jgi:MinD-like ATPase involved in chromosome partitioning or flagellar assembly
MPDQAYELRELIKSAEPPVALPFLARPAMIAVTGARTGVGATTVAVNLAAVLADRGERVVVVDAAQRHANIADVAGIKGRIKHALPDVVGGVCCAADALVAGPAGTLFLPSGGAGNEADFSRQSQQRLLVAFQSLEREASVLVVDTGSGLTPWVRRFWVRARLALLVTTTGNASLLDTYTALKRCVRDSITADVRVLANQFDSDAIALEVNRRLSTACERFLGRRTATMPALPRYTEPGAILQAATAPRVWEAPNSPFGHAMLWLGRAVSDVLQTAELVPAHDGVAFPRSRLNYSPC